MEDFGNFMLKMNFDFLMNLTRQVTTGNIFQTTLFRFTLTNSVPVNAEMANLISHQSSVKMAIVILEMVVINLVKLKPDIPTQPFGSLGLFFIAAMEQRSSNMERSAMTGLMMGLGVLLDVFPFHRLVGMKKFQLEEAWNLK